MNKMIYSKLIESYIDEELDAAGRKHFEEELSRNSQLSIEYNLDRDLELALADENLIDFRAKCITAQQEYNLNRNKTVKVIQFVRKYWYAAASVILILIIAGGALFLNPSGYSTERLFKMYYNSGESISVTRSGNSNMVEALMKYSQKDYKAATVLFGEVLKNNPTNYAVKYYDGISNIEIKDYDNSIVLFKSIISDGQNLYVENAQWYLGLAYLAKGDISDAENEFSQIAQNPDHYYNQQAKSILAKLSKSEKNKKFINNLFFLILPF
jgi:hypothetical protein